MYVVVPSIYISLTVIPFKKHFLKIEVNALAQGALRQFTQCPWIAHPSFQLRADTLPLSYRCEALGQGFQPFFIMYPFSIPTNKHVPLQHFNR